MPITLKPEHERVVMDAVNSGLANTPDEALEHALDSLRMRMPRPGLSPEESTAEAVRWLARFGKRHGLSLGGLTVKQLLRESRP